MVQDVLDPKSWTQTPVPRLVPSDLLPILPPRLSALLAATSAGPSAVNSNAIPGIYTAAGRRTASLLLIGSSNRNIQG